MGMRLTGKQKTGTGVFLLFLFVLLVSFNRCTSSVFRFFPNDYVRTRLILNTLGDASHTPEVVVFGNSRGMSGVDGYRLEEELEGNPSVYSFTSTGQKLSESMLYYSSLPSSVKLVIQCVDIDRLADPADEMDVPNRVALHMYGYEMDEETRALLPALHEKMDYPAFRYNYEARNCLFMGLASVVRNLLDDDVAVGMLESELRYPNSSLSERNEAIYRHDVEAHNRTDRLDSFYVRKEWIDLVKGAQELLARKGIAYCLVAMPYNPDITSMPGPDKARAFRTFAAEFPFVPIIDCTEELVASDFYDAIHPNRKGAEKLTARICRFLNGTSFPASGHEGSVLRAK